jgi:hypothetical protein
LAFIPVPNIAEVFIEHSLNGKPGVGWVVHYETTAGSWSTTELTELCALLRAWWNDEMKATVTAQVILQRIRARDLTTANSPIVEYNTGMPITGTGTGSSEPGNVSFSIKKNTGLAGRSFRGRIYMMGMSDTNVVGNLLNSTVANLWVAAWTEALFLSGTTYDYGMVVASRYANNAPRVSGISTPVLSVSYADLRIDTRRDRLGDV